MAKKKKEEPEPNRKVQMSFTLHRGVSDRFAIHCKDNLINKSQLLEKLIIDFFEKIDFKGMERRE